MACRRYGSIVLIVVAVLALRANQPVNQTDAAAATFASAGTVHNVTRPR